MKDLTKNEKYWLTISNKCNNLCVFCHDSDNQLKGSFKTLKEVANEIKHAQQSGAKRLILSGGEASINPAFLDIIKYAKELGFLEIQTITNGRMFYYPKFTSDSIMAGLTEITFSLHGHNEKLHDDFTGISGSWQQAVRGLYNVRQFPQIIVNIDIVINKLNYQSLVEIIKYYAANFGVFEYDLLQVIPFGRAWANKEKLFYDLDEALPYLKKVFDLAKNDKRFHIWTNRFPAQYLEDYEFLIQDPVKLFDDVLGRQEMFENYLNKNVMLNCRDKKRCQYCILHDFCEKLILLNDLLQTKPEEFELELRKLSAQPFCLDLADKKKLKIGFLDQGKINLNKFIEFYINNLYNLKSLRCKECLKKNSCNGLNINLIREKGFKILKPITH